MFSSLDVRGRGDEVLRVEDVGNRALDLRSVDLVVPLCDVLVLAGKIVEHDGRAALNL
jgi:hypothetical protein